MQNREDHSREIAAGIVVYRTTKDGPKFLLLYHGGRYWNFPKGKIKIETEEKSMEAAIRETYEETGLSADDLKIKNNFRVYERFTFFRNRRRVFKTVIFYLAETRKVDVKISPREHEGYGWFFYRDAKALLRAYKDSEVVLKKANDFIVQSRQDSQVRRPRVQVQKRV